MLDDVAAVIVPSLMNAGFKLPILSKRALKGCSSRWITVSPFRPGIDTGAISQSKLPSSLAVLARVVDVIANWSIASRVNRYRATHSSANTPIAFPLPFGSRS